MGGRAGQRSTVPLLLQYKSTSLLYVDFLRFQVLRKPRFERFSNSNLYGPLFVWCFGAAADDGE